MEEAKKSVKVIKNSLKKYEVDYKIIGRDKLNKSLVKGKDLVITLGGDGTFLRTAQYVDRTLMFGVNFNPKLKEGFLLSADLKNFDRAFDRIVKGKYKIKKLNRLQAKINNKTLKELALNEIFIGSRKTYCVSRYIIEIKGKKEFQKSSGVIVGTATGSHAWLKSAGGKILPISSDKMEFFVREPYVGRVTKEKLKKGVLDRNQKVVVYSKMNDGLVVFDSLSKEYKFNEGDKVVVSMSKKDLNVIFTN